MAYNKIKLGDLREKAENYANNVTYAYRIIYVLVTAALIFFNLKWWITISFLLAAVGLDLVDFVTKIWGLYFTYRKYRNAGKEDGDEIENPSFANTTYWVFWTLKVLMTIGVLVSIGYGLFEMFINTQPAQL